MEVLVLRESYYLGVFKGDPHPTQHGGFPKNTDNHGAFAGLGV